MSISIIGAGNMAKGLAARFTSAGHSVTLASRDEAKADAAARGVGNGVSSASLASAAQATSSRRPAASQARSSSTSPTR